MRVAIKVKVIERTQEIQVQEQEIIRRERELESTVRRPADAERYKLEMLAEAHKKKVITELSSYRLVILIVILNCSKFLFLGCLGSGG